MLDDSLLLSFMTSFFGYGNLNADYWFVGMEEAGGETAREVFDRVERWRELGKTTVVDNYDLHRSVKDSNGRPLAYLFEGRPPVQRTWRGLIRIYLAASGQPAESNEDVRAVQLEDWGRSHSNTCLLELLPLPSPGTGVWHYGEWSSIDFLLDRETYKAKLTHLRVSLLKEMMLEYRPQFVIFYSMSSHYVHFWSEISGINFPNIAPVVLTRSEDGRTYVAKLMRSKSTLFVNSYHSTYRGLTNVYFDNLGYEMRQRAV